MASRHQAGPLGGNWAQKQMGPLSRSSKTWGGVETVTPTATNSRGQPC